jgi:hypothetical protein
MGGVVGTTCVAFFYRLPRLALRLLVNRTTD